jgi:hypothetical protein
MRAVNRQLAGATTWQRIDGPVSTARRRVDYIFVLPGVDVPGHVRDSRVVLHRPGERADGSPLWPSDHYGVLADVVVAMGPGQAGVPRALGAGR